MLIARPPVPSRHRLYQPLGASALRACLALAIAVSTLTAGSGFAAAAGAAPTPGDGFGDVPSIQYQQAMQHAGDNLTFTAGAAATVPYRPRAGDSAKIDGAAPVALPAAASAGRAGATSPLGSTPAVPNVAGAAVAQAQATPATTNALRREIYGYLPYWESSAAATLNYDVLSTVAYFGLDADSAGNLVQSGTGWSGWNSSWMTGVINSAHAHGTRVALSVESFAWTSGGIASQTALLSSSTASQNLISQIVGQVTSRGVDGVSLDFEPIAAGQKTNYVNFVRALRAAFDAVQPGYEIVFDATGYVSNYDAANLLAPGAADAVFIMGYGFRDEGSDPVGSIDPLTSPKVYDLTDAVNAYKALAPASSILLGLPYYGIAWSTTTNAPNSSNRHSAACPGGGTYPTAATVSYAWASGQAASSGYQYDSVEQSAWSAYQLNIGSPCQTWAEVYYDDATSLAAKYDMVIYQGLRGAGIWVLGYDGTSHALDSVIASKFLTDTNPPKAGIVNLPDAQQNEGFPVSWTARDDWNGIRNYDVQVSTNGGAFVTWLTGTTATTSNFTGANGNNYSFRVRATDGVGNVGPWDLTATYSASPTFVVGGFATVEVTSLNERSSPTTAGATVRTAGPGTVLQIIGGPVSADGYTWYQVTGPITELNPVAPVFPGLWVAVSNGSTNYLVPTTPPNTTAVTAGISGLVVGTPGLLPSGTGIDRGHVFSPDGDGIHETLPLHWTNDAAFDEVRICIFGSDGTLVGSINRGAQPSGPEAYDWNGVVDGGSSPLPDGQYIVQIRGLVGSAAFYAPSPAPFSSSQAAEFGAIIDTTPTGTYYPVAPVRILDSRIGLGLSGAFASGQSRSFGVAGTHGVPANAIAVTGNLTVTAATVGGWVRLGSTTAGTNSTINFNAGDNRANGVTLGLASNGSLSALYQSATNKGTAHVIFDLTGYYLRDANGATFVPITPTRLVDTRIKQMIAGPMLANRGYSYMVAGLAGVPANATAVTGNATVTAATGAGYISVVPSFVPGAAPSTSTVNFPKGDTRANNVVVPLAGGVLQVEYVGPASTSVQFIFDVTGYFVPGLSGATFVPVAPGRVVDSRIGLGFTGPLATGAAAKFAVSGHAAVDPVAVAVVGNLTVTGQTSGGWLAAAPGPATSTSTLNFPVGDNRANGFVSVFGSGGSLSVTYGGGAKGSKTQFVVDVMGYYR